MSWIDTITGLVAGGALVEGVRYLRDKARATAAIVAETERTGRHEIADRAAHNTALIARVERLESQRDHCSEALTALGADLNQARAELQILKSELEATREELSDAIARAQRAEERAQQLAEEIAELRSKPISHPPVAADD